MLAKLEDLTEGSLAGMRVEAGAVVGGMLTLNLIRPGADLLTTTQVGELTVDLATGEVSGDIPDVAAETVDTIALHVEPGDIVDEPTMGLLVVQGVTSDGMRLDVTGATVSTSNVRRVGHVDLGTLDL